MVRIRSPGRAKHIAEVRTYRHLNIFDVLPKVFLPSITPSVILSSRFSSGWYRLILWRYRRRSLPRCWHRPLSSRACRWYHLQCNHHMSVGFQRIHDSVFLSRINASENICLFDDSGQGIVIDIFNFAALRDINGFNFTGTCHSPGLFIVLLPRGIGNWKAELAQTFLPQFRYHPSVSWAWCRLFSINSRDSPAVSLIGSVKAIKPIKVMLFSSATA